jgi:hypothetical protein
MPSTRAHRSRGDRGQHHDVTSPLADGRYDAFIVWAEVRDDAVALECTVTSGDHRGDVVSIASSQLSVHDELSLVGMPCTLVVSGEDVRVLLE